MFIIICNTIGRIKDRISDFNQHDIGLKFVS